jgi:hypothetical protein
MKRAITALSMVLLLLAFMWGQAMSAASQDLLRDDDHPWGDEGSNDDPGRNRNSGTDNVYVTGCLPVDIMFSSNLIYLDLRSIIGKAERVKPTYMGTSQTESYFDRTRRASLK